VLAAVTHVEAASVMSTYTSTLPLAAMQAASTSWGKPSTTNVAVSRLPDIQVEAGPITLATGAQHSSRDKKKQATAASVAARLCSTSSAGGSHEELENGDAAHQALSTHLPSG
jgi:hypothetical protein